MYTGLVGAFILWVFFLYGIFEFIRKILFESQLTLNKDTSNSKPLLVIKEQEESIELILRILHNNGIEVDVLTLPSNDDTWEIVNRFSEDLDITRTIISRKVQDL